MPGIAARRNVQRTPSGTWAFAPPIVARIDPLSEWARRAQPEALAHRSPAATNSQNSEMD